MQIGGKVALVTGAGSGLGAAACARLKAAGARVFGFERDPQRAAWLSGPHGPGVESMVVDVALEDSVRQAVRAVAEQAGALHIAVNCAGILRAAKTLSSGAVFPLQDWHDVLAVNLTGTFRVACFAAQAMAANVLDEASGERGVIVNVASGAATQGQMGQAAYSASKAGVMGLTLPMARDLAPHAIRVVAIAPGLFDTAMAASMPPQVSGAIVERMVLFPRRLGRPDEFGRLVCHVVENEYLNATTLDLDAGTRVSTR